jgi:hypothetical protein
MRKVTCPFCGTPFSRLSLVFVTTATPTRCRNCDARLAIANDLTVGYIGLYVAASIVSFLLAPILVIAWILAPVRTLIVGVVGCALLSCCWPVGKLRPVTERDVSVARSFAVIGLCVFSLLVVLAGLTDHP